MTEKGAGWSVTGFGPGKKLEAEGATPSTINDHVFVPRTEVVTVLPMYGGYTSVEPDSPRALRPTPYLCGHVYHDQGGLTCNLARAAHAE